ncbi:MAG TPA: hypothetical protein VI316_07045 [Candidatus Dormibacteraeota bacterium]
MPTQDEPAEQLPAPEAARVRARDRKRTTRMVVDNAGVKRVQLARRDRAEARRQARSDGPEGAPPPRS